MLVSAVVVEPLVEEATVRHYGLRIRRLVDRLCSSRQLLVISLTLQFIHELTELLLEEFSPIVEVESA